MAVKVEDDGNHVICWIRRLRDRTLDYTSLITHFEDDGYLRMKERREGSGKQGGEQEEEGRVWENNGGQQGVESLLYVLLQHRSAAVNRGAAAQTGAESSPLVF